MVTSEKHQKSLLGGIERFVGLTHPDLLPAVPKILMALYQKDLLDEEVVTQWGTHVSKKYVDKEISKKVRKASEPFLKVLQIWFLLIMVLIMIIFSGSKRLMTTTTTTSKYSVSISTIAMNLQGVFVFYFWNLVDSADLVHRLFSLWAPMLHMNNTFMVLPFLLLVISFRLQTKKKSTLISHVLFLSNWFFLAFELSPRPQGLSWQVGSEWNKICRVLQSLTCVHLERSRCFLQQVTPLRSNSHIDMATCSKSYMYFLNGLYHPSLTSSFAFWCDAISNSEITQTIWLYCWWMNEKSNDLSVKCTLFWLHLHTWKIAHSKYRYDMSVFLKRYSQKNNIFSELFFFVQYYIYTLINDVTNSCWSWGKKIWRGYISRKLYIYATVVTSTSVAYPASSCSNGIGCHRGKDLSLQRDVSHLLQVPPRPPLCEVW